MLTARTALGETEAVGLGTVSVFVLSDRFAVGDAAEALHLSLDWKEIPLPDLDDFVHWWRWGWELFLLAEVVEHRVGVGEQGVLDLDLRGQKLREERKYGGNQLWQVLSKVIIHSVIFLRRVSRLVDR